MQTFNLPSKLAIIRNEYGDLEAFEHDPEFDMGDPVIKINYADGACSPSTPEEWIASIKRRAVAAFERGDKSITVM